MSGTTYLPKIEFLSSTTPNLHTYLGTKKWVQRQDDLYKNWVKNDRNFLENQKEENQGAGQFWWLDFLLQLILLTVL